MAEAQEKKQEDLFEEQEEINVEVEEEESTEEAPVAASEETSEEHEQYSEGVKKRIDRLTYKMREAERREQAAIDYAKKLKDDNDKLSTNYSQASTTLVNETGGRIKSELAEAKRALKAAYEEGDSEAMADAQEMVAKLSVQNDRIAQQQAKLEAREKEVSEQISNPQPQQTVAQPQPQVDPRAEKWANENEWFGKDEAMTFTAFSIHRKLIEEEGFDPSSEDYYDEINNRLRKEFPHKFEGQKSEGNRKPVQTVAPASRNVKTGRKTVRLTQSQVAIAKKLGVPLEEYARHVKEA
tara:strand:- start:11746 stop:12633 length:888 start_codon:yes stop_codon:yes gene_type:complete